MAGELEELVRSVTAPWREDARCVAADPETFFPELGGSTADAYVLCAGCPVREECLAEALLIAPSEDFGVWGGTSVRERQRIRVERGIRGVSLSHELELQPCGTEAARKRHRARGEPACAACRQAAVRAKQDRAAA